MSKMELLWLARSRRAGTSERLGQAVFNVVAEIFPEEVEKVRGSLVDPFYDDRKIDAFCDVLGIVG